ncbi:SEC-C domain-containing protein, partial [Streptomyces lunaelactis]|nr:SEC-C domain-containing protein [Streptomyces lunaelactis]
CWCGSGAAYRDCHGGAAQG